MKYLFVFFMFSLLGVEKREREPSTVASEKNEQEETTQEVRDEFMELYSLLKKITPGDKELMKILENLSRVHSENVEMLEYVTLELKKSEKEKTGLSEQLVEVQNLNEKLLTENKEFVQQNDCLKIDNGVLRNKTNEFERTLIKKDKEFEAYKSKQSWMWNKGVPVGGLIAFGVLTFLALRIYWTLYPGDPPQIEPEEAEKQGIHMVNVEDENGNITQREETMSELWERCKAEARDYVEEHVAREDEAARVRAEQAEEDAKLPYEEAKARQEQRIKEQRAREREEARIAAEEREKRKAERAARVIKEPSKKKNSARKSKKKPSKKEKISKEV